MTAMSRNKGQASEREVASLVCDLNGWDVRRRVRQREGDSDLDGVPGWCIEVKRHSGAGRANLARWWAQAAVQAASASKPPLLFIQGPTRQVARCLAAGAVSWRPVC